MIQKAFIDKWKYSRPGIQRHETRALVMHYTAVPGATAQNIRDSYGRKIERYRSAHFAVDWGGNIVQIIPEMEKAYHCGAWRYLPGIVERLGRDPNMTTIGVEMCHEDESGSLQKMTLHHAALLAAYICKRYDLHPTSQILRHYDIMGKRCPLWWVVYPAEFERFQLRVKELMVDHWKWL